MSESQLYKESAQVGRASRPARPAGSAAWLRESRAGPQVVGHGLRHIQSAIDAQLKGVSAAKIVVSLGDR